MSRLDEYKSVDELNSAAELVVLATATEERVQPQPGRGKPPLTETRLTIEKVLRGSYGRPTLAFLQLGGMNVHVVGGPELVVPDRQYVLWLMDSKLPGVANKYYPVGAGAGMYRVDGGVAVKMDPTSDKLPTTIDVSKLLP